MVSHHRQATSVISDFHREKRSQRRQIFTLLFLGWLMCLLILQIHHPLNTAMAASFGDLNVVWEEFNQRVMGPFTDPETYHFGMDSLGAILGATATTLVALVFSGRNPLGISNEAQVRALDELLELLTLLVGVAAAATMWMALHNVLLLPTDPNSGPKFFLALLALMLVIFSVVRQRDAAVQRELEEIHLTTSMRLHTQRWERMWGVSLRDDSLADDGVIPGRKPIRLMLWWSGSGLLITLVSLILHSGFTPLGVIASAVFLVLLAVITAALTALAVSVYRSNPHPGVGLAYSAVLLVIVVLVVVGPLAAAASQNSHAWRSLLSYFIWLVPSLLLIFRKPQSEHMTAFQFRMAARPTSRFIHALMAVFDGARESAFTLELTAEARRQQHYTTKLAQLEAQEQLLKATQDHPQPNASPS